jgi:hypothetical protein
MAALALLYPDQKVLHVYARLVFYGTEATHTAARVIVEEINRMYNAPEAVVEIAGVPYRVFFIVEYALLANEATAQFISSNKDFRNNFIRLEKANYITRSFMGFGLGDNVGHWILTDQLGISTTAAHEFGHSLGLDHPAHPDFRGSGAPPPIMAPRGSLVDPCYQWEPTALPGQTGGTMKPIHRRVTVEEIHQIVAQLHFEPDGTANVGRLTNIQFDAIGQPVYGVA